MSTPTRPHLWLRRAAATLATAAVMVPSTLALALPASAEPGVSANLTSLDGRAPFNDTTGDGLDSSASNDVVRSNGAITYSVGIVVGSEPADSARVRLTLPAGVQMTSLPASCVSTQSSLTPAPATSTAWNLDPSTLTPQVVECFENGPFLANSTTALDFEARVLPGDWRAHPDITASVVVQTFSASGTYTSEVETTTDTVTQAPKYDVQVMAAQDGAGYMQWEGRYNNCSLQGPAGMTYNKACLNLRVPVQIAVPDGGRGSLPLNPAVPFEYEFDLTLDTMFGAGTRAMIAERTGLTPDEVDLRYGARLAVCSNNNPYDMPGSKIGTPATNTATNSVRDSGTTTCTYQGAPATANTAAYGKVVRMSVTGMDTTAFTAPTRTGTNLGIRPLDQFGATLYDHVYSRSHTISVPTETLAMVEQGAVQPERGSFRITTRAYPVTATIGEVTANDTHTDVMNYQNTQSVLGVFTGSPAERGTDRVTEPGVFNQTDASWTGPAGPSTFGAGDGVLFPGQTTYPATVVNQTVVPGSDTYSSLVCQAIDTDLVHLTDPQWGTPAPGQQAIGPDQMGNTGPAFLSGLLWNFATVRPGSSSWTVDQLMPQRSFQYGVHTGAGTSPADCTGVTWYDTAEEAAAAAGDTTPGDGIYEGVTHVRAWTVTSPNDPGTGEFKAANMVFTLTVPVALNDPLASSGQRVGTWSSFTSAPGTLSAEELVAATEAGTLTWTASDYDKFSDQGRRGDRVTVTATLAGLDKQVTVTGGDGVERTYGPSESWNVAAQTWAAPDLTQVPRVQAGSDITYTLTPTLPDSGLGQRFAGARIEECIPANIQFLTATYGEEQLEALDAAQFETELACDTANPDPLLRETHLVFQLPGALDEGAELTPLQIHGQVRATAPTISATEGLAGLRGGLVNEAVLSLPGVTTDTALRSSATRIYVDALREFRVSKTPVDPFVATNPQGWAVPDRLPTWDLLVVNPDANAAAKIDVVDVLPRQGEPGGNLPVSTSYTGTYTVLAPTVLSGPEALQVLYTTDPEVSLNAPDAVAWCAPAQDGSFTVTLGDEAATCPTSRLDERSGQTLLEGVTGLRLMAPELAGSQAVHAQVAIVPEGNADGDVYVNQSAGSLGGFDLAPSRQAAVRVFEGIPAAEITKSVAVSRNGEPLDGPVVPGDVLTYTVEVLNAGQREFDAQWPAMMVDSLTDVLDDATLRTASVRASVGTPRVFGDQIHWWAPLPAGDTATITYELVAKAGGDGYARNAAFAFPLDDDGDPTTPPPGETVPPTGPVEVPEPAECDDAACDVTETVIENLAVTKTMTGATGQGDTALAGDVLRYTVTMTNTSTRDRTLEDQAVLIDNMEQVLDNGELVDVVASSGVLEQRDHILRWSGPLAAGETVTLTYGIVIQPGGDGIIVNKAQALPRPTPTDPGDEEDTGGDGPGDPDPIEDGPGSTEVVTPVSTVALTKTVVGMTGEDGAARQDDVLSYTVTATNTGNTDRVGGESVVITDIWQRVLDDAVVGSLVASDGEVIRLDDRVVWVVPLTVAQTATLTYSAQVHARGDLDMRNVVFEVREGDPAQAEEPAKCREPECAETPTHVDPESVLDTSPGPDGEEGTGGAGGTGTIGGSTGGAQDPRDLVSSGRTPSTGGVEGARPGRGTLARTGAVGVVGAMLGSMALIGTGLALRGRRQD